MRLEEMKYGENRDWKVKRGGKKIPENSITFKSGSRYTYEKMLNIIIH